MKPIGISLLIISLALASACSHSEPKLADELALQELDKTEVANSAPETQPVDSQALSEPAQASFAPATIVSPKTSYKKATKKNRAKHLAKMKKKSRKKKKHHSGIH